MTDHHQNVVDAANTAIAVAAATSPFWLHILREMSEIAALIVPILGALWLTLQIVLKLHAHFKKRPDHLDTNIP